MKIKNMITSAVAIVGLVVSISAASAQSGGVVNIGFNGAITGQRIAEQTATIQGTDPSYGDPTGTLTTLVYREANNSLTFYYVVSQATAGDGNPQVGFNMLQAFNFSGFATAETYALGVSNAPAGTPNANDQGHTIYAGSSLPNPSSTLVTNGASGVVFNFGPIAASGGNATSASGNSAASTTFLVIHTNAGAFTRLTAGLTRGGDQIQSGPGAANPFRADSFSPVTGVFAPEPSTVAAFGFVGLGVVALAFRARRGKAQLAM